MLYSFLDVVLGILFKIFLRLEVHGAENIPKTGPLVIASNHLSLLDPPVIGVAAPRKVHFMAKRELFVPVLGYIYKTLGAFPVNRGGADRANSAKRRGAGDIPGRDAQQNRAAWQT